MTGNKWKNVIIHHSVSDFGCARWLRDVHINRGWRDIGYNLVIVNGRPYANWRVPFVPMIGAVEMGRPFDDQKWVSENEIGAHALGYNRNSLGVCLIHKTKFEIEQIESLYSVCKFINLHFKVPFGNFEGHYEKDSRKPHCPGFDMELFRKALVDDKHKKKFAVYLMEKKKIKSILRSL